MAFGNLNVDTITGSGASSVIVNNGTNNVAGFTTGNNLQMLQNGGGIVFSNSSATTNSTLNDYETGTWTPTANSTGGTITSYTSGGIYTKIGNIVYIDCYIYLTSVGSAAGQLGFSNLPFVINTSNSNIQPTGSGRETNITGIAFQVTNGGNPTNFYATTSSNGAITWTNNYCYTFCVTYKTNF